MALTAKCIKPIPFICSIGETCSILEYTYDREVIGVSSWFFDITPWYSYTKCRDVKFIFSNRTYLERDLFNQLGNYNIAEYFEKL